MKNPLHSSEILDSTLYIEYGRISCFFGPSVCCCVAVKRLRSFGRECHSILPNPRMQIGISILILWMLSRVYIFTTESQVVMNFWSSTLDAVYKYERRKVKRSMIFERVSPESRIELKSSKGKKKKGRKEKLWSHSIRGLHTSHICSILKINLSAERKKNVHREAKGKNSGRGKNSVGYFFLCTHVPVRFIRREDNALRLISRFLAGFFFFIKKKWFLPICKNTLKPLVETSFTSLLALVRCRSPVSYPLVRESSRTHCFPPEILNPIGLC